MLIGLLAALVALLTWEVVRLRGIIRRVASADAATSVDLGIERARADLLVALVGTWVLNERHRRKNSSPHPSYEKRQEHIEADLFALVFPGEAKGLGEAERVALMDAWVVRES